MQFAAKGTPGCRGAERQGAARLTVVTEPKPKFGPTAVFGESAADVGITKREVQRRFAVRQAHAPATGTQIEVHLWRCRRSEYLEIGRQTTGDLGLPVELRVQQGQVQTSQAADQVQATCL